MNEVACLLTEESIWTFELDTFYSSPDIKLIRMLTL
jgi:hypothetical protein